MALVSAANSTSQFFAGSTYYGTDWTDSMPTARSRGRAVLPRAAGHRGRHQRCAQIDDRPDRRHGFRVGCRPDRHRARDSRPNDQQSRPTLDSIGLVILDNNTNRAGGGFWTTYAPFAPLLGHLGGPRRRTIFRASPVLDVAYEYNINSDAPVDPLNPFALGNSLAAYAFGYGAESTDAEHHAGSDRASLRLYTDAERHTDDDP